MKQAFNYTLKIWLTTFVIAPVLVLMLTGVLFEIGWLGILFMYPRLMIGGFIPSFLSACILLEAVYLIKQRKRIYFTIVTILSTVVSFYLVAGRNTDIYFSLISYSIFNIAGIWFYNIKSVQSLQHLKQ
jgi:hypothetical protein